MSAADLTYVLGTWAVYGAAFSLLMLPIGLIRWRMARLYWQTHEGGSDGYRNDCLLLSLPLMFIAIGLVIAVPVAARFGAAVFLFIAPVAMMGAVSLALLPPWRKASARIAAARKPLEPAHVR